MSTKRGREKGRWFSVSHARVWARKSVKKKNCTVLFPFHFFPFEEVDLGVEDEGPECCVVVEPTIVEEVELEKMC
jgi:hypothetical protein